MHIDEISWQCVAVIHFFLPMEMCMYEIECIFYDLIHLLKNVGYCNLLRAATQITNSWYSMYTYICPNRGFFTSNRMVVLQDLFLVNHGKSPFLMGKLTKWQFSIAMLVYQRVSHDSDFQCICYWLVESAFPHGPSAAISPEIFHWAIDDALPVVEIMHH